MAKSQPAKSPVIRPGTGSGSRPNSGTMKIKHSAPEDKHTLGKAPKGALK